MQQSRGIFRFHSDRTKVCGQLPLAGILAVAAVFAVDVGILGSSGPWPKLQQRISRRHPLEWGITQDRLEIRRLADAPPTVSRAVIVGSSRANAGFQRRTIDPSTSQKIVFAKIAHAFVGPFEIRSLVEEILAVGVDVVVLVLSEFDVNRPARITPQASFGSFSASKT